MEKEIEAKTNEFNKVVDATSNFLKAIFPHTYSWIKSIKDRKKIEKEEVKKV
jgi:hypothetical protein